MAPPLGEKANPVPHQPYGPPEEASSIMVGVKTDDRPRRSAQRSSHRLLLACQPGARVILSAVEKAIVLAWTGDHSAYRTFVTGRLTGRAVVRVTVWPVPVTGTVDTTHRVLKSDEA